MNSLLPVLALATALGCGLIAGLFFAFSVCVMAALARLPAAQGMAAMQAINAAILNPVFLGVFFAVPAGCAVLAVAAALGHAGPGGGYLLAGAGVYLAGSFAVTLLFNVPRNNALAAAAPDGPAGERLWPAYLRVWTAWNHVRTIASLAAAALLTLGLWAGR